MTLSGYANFTCMPCNKPCWTVNYNTPSFVLSKKKKQHVADWRKPMMCGWKMFACRLKFFRSMKSFWIQWAQKALKASKQITLHSGGNWINWNDSISVVFASIPKIFLCIRCHEVAWVELWKCGKAKFMADNKMLLEEFRSILAGGFLSCRVRRQVMNLAHSAQWSKKCCLISYFTRNEIVQNGSERNCAMLITCSVLYLWKWHSWRVFEFTQRQSNYSDRNRKTISNNGNDTIYEVFFGHRTTIRFTSC